MKRWLLWIWKWLPGWMQIAAAALLRPHYQVAVAAMIFNAQGELLLCEHTYRRKYPWGLPGGDLKHGEDPQAGCRRELLEETGLQAGRLELILVENSRHAHHLNLIYLGGDAVGNFRPNEEIASMRYFDLASLPVFSAHQDATIRRCLELAAQRKGSTA